MFINKCNLTLKENIFIAKKLISETIYNTAKLEGCNVTFPQTETILNGVSVSGLKMSDVEKILNLRDAWKFVLDTIEEPLSITYWSKINGYVARNESLEWGVLRYGDVGISGTDYKPPIPTQQSMMNTINKILNSDITPTEKALELFLNGCRFQFFWDGNKRTSTIVANKYMIQNGVGIFTIPDKKLEEFSGLLSDFYSTNENFEIKNFLYHQCIKKFTINQKNQKI